MKYATVSISTRGNYIYANGYQKAQIRLTINRKSHYYVIPYAEFLPENWDEKNKRVKRKTPDYADINAQISYFFNKANEILRQYSKGNSNITPNSFEMSLFNRGYETDFFEYARSFANKYTNESTKNKCFDTISKFKEFTRCETLSFGEIDDVLLINFKSWCINVRNNREITADRGLGIIRTIFNEAIKEGKITENPVRKIKIKSHPGKQKNITVEAVQYLIKYLQTEKLTGAYKNSLSAYIFACCCGLRYSDIQKMKFKDLKGNILETTEKKTGKYRKIEIMKSALSLIDFSRATGNDQNIFKLCKTPSPTGKILKDIAQKINKREGREIICPEISFHTSRSTFATCAESFSDIYTAAQLTGNNPEIAAKHYVSKNVAKEKQVLKSIENDYFNITEKTE